MAGADPTDVARVRAALSRVADALYRIDADPEARLLRDPSALEGVSAALAERLQPAFERIWVDYPALKQHVDEVMAAGAPLAPDVGARVAQLETDVQEILDAAAKVAQAWRTALPRVDELRNLVAAVTADASTVGVGADPELAHAARLVEHLAQQSARDPLSVDAQPATRAVSAVADRIGDLTRMRASLPADLVEAAATLDEITRLIDAGRSALERARERVVRPTGLLEPLSADALDDPQLGLRPWFRRIDDEARAGRWLAAARGLERWRAVAAGWLANARRVVDANEAPIRRRDELRGLLDAYRAKAAATGKAEDRTLTDALQQARDALFTAPCDLEEADRLVQAYVRLVRKNR